MMYSNTMIANKPRYLCKIVDHLCVQGLVCIWVGLGLGLELGMG